MCCGRNSQSSATQAYPQSAPRLQLPLAGVSAQYVGATALTVVGPVSGRHYQFVGCGARLELDRRDLHGLARIPNLRFIR